MNHKLSVMYSLCVQLYLVGIDSLVAAHLFENTAL